MAGPRRTGGISHDGASAEQVFRTLTGATKAPKAGQGLRRRPKRDPFGALSEIHLGGARDDDGGGMVIHPAAAWMLAVGELFAASVQLGDVRAAARVLARCSR